MKYQLILICVCFIMKATSYPNQYPQYFDYNVTMSVSDPFTSDKRFFLLNIPYNASNVSSDTKFGAVILLHGSESSGLQYGYISGMGPKASALGLAVAYGQSVNVSGSTDWNVGGCCGPTGQNQTQVDDIAYLSDMISILTADYQIDEKRIYMAGWSNGGMMTMTAVCELGDKIKAAVPYAGGLEMKQLPWSLANTTTGGSDWGKETQYPMNTNFTEIDWFKLPNNWFTCEKGEGVPMLIVIGQDDVIVPMTGMMAKVNADNRTYGIPPTKFSQWYYASLNEELGHNATAFSTSYKDFQVNQTYQNQFNESSIACSQLIGRDSSPLKANITVCTGTGGHTWWTKEQQNMSGIVAQLFGPNNQAFDLTDEVLNFACRNDAHCKGWLKDDHASKKGHDNTKGKHKKKTSFKLLGIGALVLLILVGACCCYFKKKNPENDSNSDMSDSVGDKNSEFVELTQ